MSCLDSGMTNSMATSDFFDEGGVGDVRITRKGPSQWGSGETGCGWVREWVGTLVAETNWWVFRGTRWRACKDLRREKLLVSMSLFSLVWGEVEEIFQTWFLKMWSFYNRGCIMPLTEWREGGLPSFCQFLIWTWLKFFFRVLFILSTCPELWGL